MEHVIIQHKEFKFDVSLDGTIIRMPRKYTDRWGNIKTTKQKLLPIRISEQGYPCVYSGNGIINLHLLIARAFLGDTPRGYMIDHINGNKLDYRLENLRHVTHSDNGLNISSPQKNRGSGYLGVHSNGRTGSSVRWKACFKHRYLGTFLDKDLAISVVEDARERHFMSLDKPGYAYGLAIAAC